MNLIQAPKVTILNHIFCITCPIWDNERAKGIPDCRWSRKDLRWEVPITLSNAKYIEEKYADDEIETIVLAKIHELIKNDLERPPFPAWFKFKEPPMKCQMEALNKAFTKDEFAYIMDMGTGKTFTTINFGAAKAMMGKINGMLVICDTTGKPVWMKEFEKFCPIDYDMFVMEQGKQKRGIEWAESESTCFKVLVVGVESLSTGPHAKDVAWKFLSKHKTFMLVDESSSIKNPLYKRGRMRQSRTHVCWDMGGIATYRAILNGTPVDEGVEDFFAQFRFLNWQIIGEKNFTLFKAKYCVMGGFEGRKIIGYMNLKELFDRVAPYVYEVRITDVEDMPGQSREVVYCTPTPEQKRALKELGDPMMTTTQDDLYLKAETVLERMIRYQQIVGGFFPYDLTEEQLAKLTKSEARHRVTQIKGSNPKMEALFRTLEQLGTSRKVIIWAAFTPERLAIVEEFTKRGITNAIHMGSGLTAAEKYTLMDVFQTIDEVQFLVTSQKIAGKSVTLHAATVSIYYSNTHSYNKRLQSERRIWRKGQNHPCLYIDIIMDEKTDRSIIKALSDKKDILEYVQDELRRHSKEL